MQAPQIVTNYGLDKVEEKVKYQYFKSFITGKNFSQSQKVNLLNGLFFKCSALTIAENAEISPEMATDFLEGYEAMLSDSLQNTQIVKPHGLHGFIDIDDIFYTESGLFQLVSQEAETEVDITNPIDISHFQGRSVFMKAVGDPLPSYRRILGIHKPANFKEILTTPDKGRKVIQRQDIVSMYCHDNDSFHVVQLSNIESLDGIRTLDNYNEISKIQQLRVGDEFGYQTIIGTLSKDTLVKRLTQYKSTK